MSMRLGYDLTIEQTQKLNLTPELIQAIKILQFNTFELEAYVQEQIMMNPVLEQDETETSSRGGEDVSGDAGTDRKEENNTSSEPESGEFDWKEFIRNRQYDDVSYKNWGHKGGEERENPLEATVTSDITLHENLLFQLQFAFGRKKCRYVGRYIIESMDENGYVTLSEKELSEMTGVKEETVLEVLKTIQTFDPPGVGARSLKECLMIQLKQQNMLDDAYESLINEHLVDLADNRLMNISKDMGMTVDEIRDMRDVIKNLEPKPGRQFASQRDVKYIIPDVTVENVDGEYVVSINETGTPRLVVSSYYKNMINEAETDDNLAKYLSSRVSSAMWLIKIIEQRKQTIFNVVSAVVKYQKDFFDKGEKFLKTLTLKEIAEELDIHESTVSRSINGKYMQSPRGIFEIKYFFSAGVADIYGEGISSKSIKVFIREIIDSENRKNPYSDQKIVGMLGDKGINISRRTVAKYRDELGIPSSSKRRKY